MIYINEFDSKTLTNMMELCNAKQGYHGMILVDDINTLQEFETAITENFPKHGVTRIRTENILDDNREVIISFNNESYIKARVFCNDFINMLRNPESNEFDWILADTATIRSVAAVGGVVEMPSISEEVNTETKESNKKECMQLDDFLNTFKIIK